MSFRYRCPGCNRLFPVGSGHEEECAVLSTRGDVDNVEGCVDNVIEENVDNVGVFVDNAATEKLSTPLSTAERVKRWRERNRERYNAQMREYRRRRRDERPC